MPLAIVTSKTQSRHRYLLLFNIAGVLLCMVTEVLLVLTALDVIFVEPEVAPVLQDHINSYACLGMRKSGGDGLCCEDLGFEDAYLFFLRSN